MYDNNFYMGHQDILKTLGLSDLESRVYIAALEAGESLPKHLAEKAGVKRPMLYKLLPLMIEGGLLSETRKGKRRYLVAEDPETYLDKKRADLALVEQVIPELRLLLRTASVKPQVVFYGGIENLKKLYMDTLHEKKPIMEFVSVEKIHPEIELYSKHYYIPQRINRRIPIRIIVSGETRSQMLNLRTEPYSFREVKTIEQKRFPVPLDAYIYGDNVSFVLYRTDSEPVGIIIRSKEIATVLRSLFEFVWERA